MPNWTGYMQIQHFFFNGLSICGDPGTIPQELEEHIRTDCSAVPQEDS